MMQTMGFDLKRLEQSQADVSELLVHEPPADSVRELHGLMSKANRSIQGNISRIGVTLGMLQVERELRQISTLRSGDANSQALADLQQADLEEDCNNAIEQCRRKEKIVCDWIESMQSLTLPQHAGELESASRTAAAQRDALELQEQQLAVLIGQRNALSEAIALIEPRRPVDAITALIPLQEEIEMAMSIYSGTAEPLKALQTIMGKLEKTVASFKEGMTFSDLVGQRDALVVKIEACRQQIGVITLQLQSSQRQIEFLQKLDQLPRLRADWIATAQQLCTAWTAQVELLREAASFEELARRFAAVQAFFAALRK